MNQWWLDNWCIHASLSLNELTHWGRVTHICVGKQTIIGSDNGLSPGRRQAIIWTNDGILLIGPLGTNFSEISIKILTFSFTKMRLKVSSAKWRPFCFCISVLTLSVGFPVIPEMLHVSWGVLSASLCQSCMCTMDAHKGALTLNMREPSYLGLTRSILWLLMPWLLT